VKKAKASSKNSLEVNVPAGALWSHPSSELRSCPFAV
jgi:hypothetical protein